jgi:hypothetical protein
MPLRLKLKLLRVFTKRQAYPRWNSLNLKYKLHTDQELFDKAYNYIRQYY